MRSATLPLVGLVLAVWLVADPRGLGDTASEGRARAWEATDAVLASAATLVPW